MLMALTEAVVLPGRSSRPAVQRLKSLRNPGVALGTLGPAICGHFTGAASRTEIEAPHQPCLPDPFLKITAQQIAAQGQPQKVTYTTQPALKTQFLTTPISQAQKLTSSPQVQTQIQVAKLPQVVQQQSPVTSIQQVASASQQASPQTVTLTQATAAGQQVQVIPAVTATAQVVQQKLMQQQVVTTATAQLQSPGVPAPTPVPTSDSPSQQPKLQMRVPTVRLKTPTKPPCP